MAAKGELTRFDLVQRWNAERDKRGWWHSFELPDGFVIQGVCELAGLKNRIRQFPIPQDLKGRRVLDIGAWDGWFSFEMERRGAEVLAIDNWDNPRFHQARALLNSRVEYRQMDVYELTPQRVGYFDIVLFMGVLYHLKHPLLALERVCALATEMAAVDSFVLREKHRPGEKVDQRPVMEFYETDEFGGQTDNWVAPSLTCLEAFCRTAGFARVELQSVLDHSACLACYRHWEQPAVDAPEGPELVSATNNLSGGVHFDSSRDELVSAWFRSKSGALGLDDVRPEVAGYGVRPIHVARTDETEWQTNFKLPPGLTPGWHEVRLRLGPSRPGSPQRIAVDAPPGAREIQPQRGGAQKMNVQKVVREIHARLEEKEGVESVRASEELTALRNTLGRLFQMAKAVGQMPPAPNTLRARIGKQLIRGVQRCLFWYTPQLVRFQTEAINALDRACNLIARQLERTAAIERDEKKQLARTAALEEDAPKQLERTAALEADALKLREEVSKLKLQLSLVAAIPRAPEPVRDHEPARPLPDAFQFALQDRFRGPECETRGKLQPYLSALETWADSLPQGPWLDIGCGRGEWLEAAGGYGYTVLGIDANPSAVAHCCAKGLNAEQADALGYLRALKSESLAVVTAFHAVEHFPVGYFLALMQEAVRALQPGGLLIIETPNPANLLMGSFHFWNDPTHCRPIPPALLEFVYQYFGLKVVQRLDLNPPPQNERLPYDEIGVVHRLNESLYGPQDYGLIGRR